MTPEIQTEMAELRAKVSELALHATTQTELAIPDALESGDDIYTMEVTPRMFDDVSEDALLLALNRYAAQLSTSGRGGSLPTNFGYAERALVSQKCLDDITLQLFALNLSH